MSTSLPKLCHRLIRGDPWKGGVPTRGPSEGAPYVKLGRARLLASLFVPATHQVAGKRFTFIGFPLRLRGAHGKPTRAVALLEG
jgi:hypothetical protein